MVGWLRWPWRQVMSKLHVAVTLLELGTHVKRWKLPERCMFDLPLSLYPQTSTAEHCHSRFWLSDNTRTLFSRSPVPLSPRFYAL